MKVKTGRIREQNSLKILAAAEAEFVKHGFKGTSMQNIADAAELPKANVLYYFSSKKNLYVAVLSAIAERWDSNLDDMHESQDPGEVLNNYIRNKVDLAIQYPNASKIYATEIIQGAPNLKEHMRTGLRTWLREKTRVIEAWIAQGKMDRVDPNQLIFLIWSSTQHYADFEAQILTVSNKQEYDSDDVEQIKRFLCQVILKGVGLTPPGNA
ncbi:MAG: TetR/AcrR family transcriptional regulator [Oleiphilus sp.]|nr:MAG: TetR/AcrR family transcriptional regulator [Oleiphilus sp.]